MQTPERRAEREEMVEQRTAEPRPSLLEAGLALSAVMRAGGADLAEAADRLAWTDPNPYPLTYVVMSNQVIDFLRALAVEQQAEQPVEAARASEPAPLRRAYGPPLRASDAWAG